MSLGSEARPLRVGIECGRRTCRTRADPKSILTAMSGAGGGAAAVQRLH
jgi:hypothetical protein